ncbi:MAG: histidine--tRNA ligase [Flavobacteriales bacterium]|nr:histidine--tRNA ligase [Flavobacteriales bacterium]
MSKPSIPKGTRDFSPTEMVRRNYIFDTIKKSFIKYGFLPIETPSMENLKTLTGKYGDEGDKLIFKVLNSGDYLKKADKGAIEEENSSKLISSISEKALRYDLTVPFARYVVQHQNDIAFPFKRYQIQPVWRADRPQRGRYREFYQCDADVVGSNSLLYEVEIVQLLDEVLYNLGIPGFTIKINNRKVLSGIAEITGESDKIIDITVAIDKLDKIGEEGVIKELESKEVSASAIEKIKPLFLLKGDYKKVILEMKKMLQDSEIGLRGIEELAFIFETINALGLKKATFEFDVTLARGLNYYTGAIFEVSANNVKMGSISGGGRYDDLTGIFGLKDVSGVGISFGADRIYDVLDELELFPEFSAESTQVMLVNFGIDDLFCLQILKELRENGINAEFYPSSVKLKKQMKYANDKNIPFVIFINEEEVTSNILELKNMLTGDQQKLTIKDVITTLMD